MSRQPLCTLRLIARLCCTRRYDIEEYVREWLANNGNEEHPTFEHLSLIEVVLVDDRFEEIRPHVGISDAFISHMDMDPFLGMSSGFNANGIVAVHMQQITTKQNHEHVNTHCDSQAPGPRV